MPTKWSLTLPKELGAEFVIGGVGGRPATAASSLYVTVPPGAEGVVFQALYGQLQKSMQEVLAAGAGPKGSASPASTPTPVPIPTKPPPVPSQPPPAQMASNAASALLKQFGEKLQVIDALTAKVATLEARVAALEITLGVT
jgi:hypothetical protein